MVHTHDSGYVSPRITDTVKHSSDSGGVPPSHPLLNLLGRVVAMTHTGEDQELDYWILVFWTFLCLSRGHAGACILCR